MPSYRQTGTVLTDHVFGVPLDHERPDGERIEVFAREVAAADGAAAGLPWLVFLQGGPGFSEYEHDGLRVSSGAVLDRLIALARGTA